MYESNSSPIHSSNQFQNVIKKKVPFIRTITGNKPNKEFRHSYVFLCQEFLYAENYKIQLKGHKTDMNKSMG